MEETKIVFKIATKVWWNHRWRANTRFTRNGRPCKGVEIELVQKATWKWRLESSRRWEKGNTQYRELVFIGV